MTIDCAHNPSQSVPSARGSGFEGDQVIAGRACWTAVFKSVDVLRVSTSAKSHGMENTPGHREFGTHRMVGELSSSPPKWRKAAV